MNWPTTQLAEIADLLSGGTPPKADPRMWDGQIPWVSPKDMDRWLLDDAEDHVAPTAIGNGTRIAPLGATLIVVRSMGLASRVQLAYPRRDVAFNQDLKAIVARPGIHPRFLFYALAAARPRIHEQVDEASHGTKRIQTYVLETLPIPVPPEAKQAAIAMVLGALDDKIDLNQHTIDNCLALCHSMFDLASRDAVNSVPLFRVAAVHFGFPFRSGMFNARGDGIPLIRIRDLQSGAPTVWTTEESPLETNVKPGDVLVGMDGEFRCYYWLGTSARMNQRVCRIQPIGTSRAYLAEALRGPLAAFEAGKTGTTVIHLNKVDLETVSVPVVPESAMDVFSRKTEPLVDLAVALAGQNRNLTQLRDALLPELISGRMTVN